jgi:hypothetical protein
MASKVPDWATPPEIAKPQPGEPVNSPEAVEKSFERGKRALGIDRKEMVQMVRDARLRVRRGGRSRPWSQGIGPGRKLGAGKWQYRSGRWWPMDAAARASIRET